MLNFKDGKIYKDTKGNDWEFLFYEPESKYQYCFRSVRYNNRVEFYEQKDNSVTFWKDGSGVKIPFVEEKERDWVVGEEYECYNTVTEKISKVKLLESDYFNRSQKYRFDFDGKQYWLYGKGRIVCYEYYVVFKNGVPRELKDRLNKGKLTNKQKFFTKGQVYKDIYGAEYMFMKRIKAPDGLYAIFYEKKDDEAVALELYKINNVECCLLLHRVDLCPDESIRNEDVLKAVRVVQ